MIWNLPKQKISRHTGSFLSLYNTLEDAHRCSCADGGSMEPAWFQRLQPAQKPLPRPRWRDKPAAKGGPVAGGLSETPLEGGYSAFPYEEHQQTEIEKSKLFTCGCGHLGAELLCSLLRQSGVRSVLDVRELDHSTKRPWFNSDVLQGTMHTAGLRYKYHGQEADDQWAASVANAMKDMDAPVCLLGVRALVKECPRLRLSQKLQVVFEKQRQLREHIQHVTSETEAALGFGGSWQERIKHRYANVMSWDDWDKTRQLPSPGDEPLVISLPFDTTLLVIPGFLSKSQIYSLQQATLPGAVNYEQPRRQVRNPDGTFTQFNERHKEAWLCSEYNYRDTRRVPGLIEGLSVFRHSAAHHER
eukprot:s244_g43.t2